MEDKPFLNIVSSAMGRVWRNRCDETQQRIAMTIAQKYAMPEILARVLAGRGVGVTQAQDFINPTLRQLMPDPAGFQDMDKAVNRLVQAIEKQEKISIFADYDVDGACSAAMLQDFFSFFGLKPRLYIPDRLLEGYGPNVSAMRMLAHEGATLIITVDCGSLSDEPIYATHQAGADVVVLDHHQMGISLPEAACAVVNPNRPDDLSNHGFLCAAGVVFIVLAGVLRLLRAQGKNKNLPDLLALLDLVALATICDVVALQGVNRAFVVKGLQVMRCGQRVGLMSLIKSARIDAPLTPFHLGFLLGPRINAGGRIGDPTLGSQLLSCTNPENADRIAAKLEELNTTRQLMETHQLQEAEAQAALLLEKDTSSPITLVASHDWHPGLIGLLAARLKERYLRPAIVLALHPDGRATGSARSHNAFDIGALIRKAVHAGLLDKGGGHTMAAGLSLSSSSIEDFRQWCISQMKKDTPQVSIAQQLLIDGVVSSGGVTVEFCQQLERSGPFGASHEEPVFVLPSHRIIDMREVGKGHLSLTLANREGIKLKAIAFRAVGSELGNFLYKNRDHLIHVAGCAVLNHWNGRTSPQLRLVDAAYPN